MENNTDDTERKRKLDEITAHINAHKGNEFEVGRSLMTIRDEHLYRPGFETFEDYAWKKFEWRRRTAYNWIDLVRVNLTCEPEACAQLGTTAKPPINHAHVRQMLKLPMAQQKATWDQIKEKAKIEGKAVTGAYAAPIVQAAQHAALVANAQQAAAKGTAAVASTEAERQAEIARYIFIADNRNDVPEIEDVSLDLVIGSPPYNINTRYDVFRDNQARAEFLDDLTKAFGVIHRKLKRGGRLIINVPSVTNNAGKRGKGYVFHLGDAIKTIVAGLPLEDERDRMVFYQEVVWNKGVISNAQESAWGSYLKCSQPNCRRMTERVYVWGKGTTKRKAIIERQDLGIDEAAWRQAAIDVWRIPVDSTLVQRYGHPCAFPVELPKRCMQFFGEVQDRIWDPWGGIGSTAVAAAECGRICFSTDLSPDYTEIARGRVVEAVRSGPQPLPRITAEQLAEIERRYLPETLRNMTVDQADEFLALLREAKPHLL